MDPIANDVLGQILRYAAFIAVSITGIVVCINMLKPKPDFRELAKEIKSSFDAWQQANTEAHTTFEIEHATLMEKTSEHSRRLDCIDSRCREEKELIRDMEKRLHVRVDLMAADLSGINKQLGGVESGVKGLGKQLDVISRKMMDGGRS